MNKLITNIFKEPYVNVLCVEFGISLDEYKKNKTVNIVIGLFTMIILILLGIVIKSMLVVILAVIIGYLFYRRQYLKLKKLENKTKEHLKTVYPVFVQTFISLLYTNDNLIKVFLLLENYHFDPYIDRAIVIMVNKYQHNPENDNIIFAEFCNIFEVTSASLLHQLLVNISRYGVNNEEIVLVESKIRAESDKYIHDNATADSKLILQYGYIAITLFITLIALILLSTI